MRTIKHNGETWYVDRRPLAKRIRQWFVQSLGWEVPDRTRGEYSTRLKFRRSWGRFGIGDPFPLLLFGGRVSIFSSWIDIRTPSGHLHWGFRKNPSVMYGPYGTGYCYISRDGTPSNAHIWLWGAEKYHDYPEIARSLEARRIEYEGR